MCLTEGTNKWTPYQLNGNELAAAPVVWHALRWEQYVLVFSNGSRDDVNMSIIYTST